jgi:hypothetical protein
VATSEETMLLKLYVEDLKSSIEEEKQQQKVREQQPSQYHTTSLQSEYKPDIKPHFNHSLQNSNSGTNLSFNNASVTNSPTTIKKLFQQQQQQQQLQSQPNTYQQVNSPNPDFVLSSSSSIHSASSMSLKRTLKHDNDTENDPSTIAAHYDTNGKKSMKLEPGEYNTNAMLTSNQVTTSAPSSSAMSSSSSSNNNEFYNNNANQSSNVNQSLPLSSISNNHQNTLNNPNNSGAFIESVKNSESVFLKADSNSQMYGQNLDSDYSSHFVTDYKNTNGHAVHHNHVVGSSISNDENCLLDSEEEREGENVEDENESDEEEDEDEDDDDDDDDDDDIETFTIRGSHAQQNQQLPQQQVKLNNNDNIPSSKENGESMSMNANSFLNEQYIRSGNFLNAASEDTTSGMNELSANNLSGLDDLGDMGSVMGLNEDELAVQSILNF